MPTLILRPLKWTVMFQKWFLWGTVSLCWGYTCSCILNQYTVTYPKEMWSFLAEVSNSASCAIIQMVRHLHLSVWTRVRSLNIQCQIFGLQVVIEKKVFCPSTSVFVRVLSFFCPSTSVFVRALRFFLLAFYLNTSGFLRFYQSSAMLYSGFSFTHHTCYTVLGADSVVKWNASVTYCGSVTEILDSSNVGP